MLLEFVPLADDAGELTWERFSGTMEQCAALDAEWADRVYRTRHPFQVAYVLQLFVKVDSIRYYAKKAGIKCSPSPSSGGIKASGCDIPLGWPERMTNG